MMKFEALGKVVNNTDRTSDAFLMIYSIFECYHPGEYLKIPRYEYCMLQGFLCIIPADTVTKINNGTVVLKCLEIEICKFLVSGNITLMGFEFTLTRR